MVHSTSTVGRLEIRIPNGADLGEIYQWVNDPRVAHHWRSVGMQFTPESFRESVFASMTAHFAGIQRNSDRLVAYASLFAMNLRAGHAQIGVLSAPEAVMSGFGIEVGVFAASHGFMTYPLRKLYLELPAFNVGPLERLLGRYCVEEARFPDHVYWNGALHATHVYSISRCMWEGEARQTWERLLG